MRKVFLLILIGLMTTACTPKQHVSKYSFENCKYSETLTRMYNDTGPTKGRVYMCVE